MCVKINGRNDLVQRIHIPFLSWNGIPARDRSHTQNILRTFTRTNENDIAHHRTIKVNVENERPIQKD